MGDSARIAVAITTLGLLLAVPGVFVGPVLDDWLFRLAVEEGRWWDLYDFVGPGEAAELREQGLVPWWTADGFEQRFFRPLASVLYTMDVRIGAVFAAATLLAWRATALWGAWTLFRAVMPERSALWALALLATENGLVAAGTWHANRHALIATALGVWSLAFLVRDSSRDRRVSAGLFAVALCAGELALGVFGFVVAWAVRQRNARSVTLHAGVVAVYVALYVASGRGARGGDFYLHPLTDPWGWLAEAPLRGLALVADGVTQVPSMLAFLEGWMPLVLGGLGAACLVWMLRGGWWAAGALLALVPAVSAPASSRQLALAGVGFVAVLAMRLPRPVLALSAALGGVLSLQSAWGLNRVGSRSVAIAASLDEVCPSGPIAVVNAPDHVIGFYLPVLRAAALHRADRPIVALTMRAGDVRVSGRSPTRVQADLGGSQIERFWSPTIAEGPVTTGPFMVTRTPSGLDVDAPADTCWVAWTAAGFQAFEPGTTARRWPRATGPSGLP